ncbi:MAG: fumarylacetoacetate hydrolase family protein [Alloprevotella sp.]|nr:fumarylacetoacetate hydrolase family protein [Alloprevotella sp.]
MKTFIFEGNYPSYNIQGIFPLSDKEDCPATAVYTVPDTALLTRGRPLFLPEWAEPCAVQAHLAVRICRLGKGIPARFAHRYYDAVTVATVFTATELLEKLRKEGLPWLLAKSFDGAVALGEFQPKEDASTALQLTRNGQTIQLMDTREMLHTAEELIAAASRNHKLCHGDLLLCGTSSPGATVCENDRIEGFLGEMRLLAFNVK